MYLSTAVTLSFTMFFTAIPAAILAVSVSCSDSAGPATVDTLPGTYVLQSVNGEALPYRSSLNCGLLSCHVILLREEFKIHPTPPGTCEWIVQTRVEVSGQVPSEDTSTISDCYWALVGTEVRVNGTAYIGSLAGRTLTLVWSGESGNTYIYTKK